MSRARHDAYVAATDNDWFRFLSERDGVDEVNFWYPKPWGGRFGVLSDGQPLLFKLKRPHNHMTVAVLLLALWTLTGCHDDEGTRDRRPPVEMTSPDRPAAIEGRIEQSRWDQAAQAIRRLPVDSFPDLPDHVRARLAEADCLVPQIWADPEAHNVVRGTFAAPEQEDWAVLCSRDGKHRILMVWGGPARCDADFEESEDGGALQVVGEDEIGFSRAIRPVDPEQIRRYHEAFGGPEPPEPLTHQGIDDAFVGKASTVLYCEGGEWLRLTGMD